jgi:hypothetical protein
MPHQHKGNHPIALTVWTGAAVKCLLITTANQKKWKLACKTIEGEQRAPLQRTLPVGEMPVARCPVVEQRLSETLWALQCPDKWHGRFAKAVIEIFFIAI